MGDRNQGNSGSLLGLKKDRGKYSNYRVKKVPVKIAGWE